MCCQTQPLPQLLARHCHVSQSWRAGSHLALAWNHPQDTVFSFTALKASTCSGFLASCLTVPNTARCGTEAWKAAGCFWVPVWQMDKFITFIHLPDDDSQIVMTIYFWQSVCRDVVASKTKSQNHDGKAGLLLPLEADWLFSCFAVAINPIPEAIWAGLHNLTSAIYSCVCIPGQRETNCGWTSWLTRTRVQLRGRHQQLTSLG